MPTLKSRAARWAGLTIALACAAGCATLATSGPPQRFFSEPAPAAASAGPAQDTHGAAPFLTIQGEVDSRLGYDALLLRITNTGPVSFRLEYVADRYVAHTWDGRAVTLEKDLLTYTQVVTPGTEASVTLLLPSGLVAEDITDIVATFESGGTVILKSTGAWQREQERGRPLEPLAPEYRGASGGSALHALSAASWANVPAVVELHQDLGGTIRVMVRWNEELAVTRLRPGEHRDFSLLPGQHELHFVSRMPPMGETRGTIPVTASPGWPIRIALEASPHPWGSKLAVRMWQRSSLVWDRHYGSGAAEP